MDMFYTHENQNYYQTEPNYKKKSNSSNKLSTKKRSDYSKGFQFKNNERA